MPADQLQLESGNFQGSGWVAGSQAPLRFMAAEGFEDTVEGSGAVAELWRHVSAFHSRRPGDGIGRLLAAQ
ncbi:MAG: hypothetical protein KDD10_19735 [Phaeodactylibacter sp.]|nr:hypothetical protein [Phaeodactylibacter sp.]